MLFRSCWGTPRGEGLPLPDAPPTTAITEAQGVLAGIGAVNDRGEATDLGRTLATLPVDPRLGRALVQCGPAAAETVALLADAPRGDLTTHLRTMRGQARFDREVRRLRRLAPSGDGTSDPGLITALAYPGRIARREGEDYLLASGTRAILPPGSPLQGAPWLAVAEATRSAGTSREGRAGAMIRAAARIAEDDALAVIGVQDTVTATLDGGRIRGRKLRRAGAIVLSETPVKVAREQATEALAEGIRQEGLSLFIFSEKAQSLRERLDFLHGQIGDPWPEVAAADPTLWLGPELAAVAGGASIGRVDLYPALQRLLPWPEATRLAELAPERLRVPSGNTHRVDYATGRPVVRVKLQECFGLDASPELAGVPVQFHLLSPAGRPLAVTDDLASFWAGPYGQVRAEMRGRYPRHPWPEDPWTAPATARTKKRM